MIVLIAARDRHRRPGRDRAAVSSSESTTEPVAGRQALRRAAARRARHLRARGLLQLPLADDPAVARRDRSATATTRWPASSSTTIRSSGAASAPGRTCTRRRPLQRRVAPRAPDQPARRGARVEHAGLSLAARRPRSTAAASARTCARCARVGVPYTDDEIAGAADAVQRQDRDGRAGRLPAGPRHGLGELVSAAWTSIHFAASSPACCWCCSSGWSSGPGARAAARTSTRRRDCRSDDDEETDAMTRLGQSIWSIIVAHRARTSPAACGCCGGRARSPGEGATSRRHHRPRLGRGPARVNNPLPRWWMWLFIITVVFGVAYLVLYPGLGTFTGHAQLDLAQRTRGRGRAATRERIETYAGAVQRAQRRRARRATRRRSRSAERCSSTTARTATAPTRAARGFPNLADNDWLYGGDARDWSQTITNGRTGVMPPMGRGARQRDGVEDVASYVLQPAAAASSRPATARAGRAKFAGCAPPATAPTARATRRSARPTSPTTSGCTAARWPRCATASTRAARRHAGACRRARRDARQTTGRVRAVAAAGRAAAVASAGNADDTPTADATELGERGRAHGRHRWSSFLAAALGTMVCFAFVDPLAIARRRSAGVVDHAPRGLRARLLPVLADRPAWPPALCWQLARPERRGR